MYSDLLFVYLLELAAQVLSIGADNASPNDVMMEEIIDMLPEISRLSPETRIRCLAHILNLVVKVCLLLYLSSVRRA